MGQRRVSFFGAGGKKAATPQALLAALRIAPFTWDLATDALDWGPSAADALELPSIIDLAAGESLVERVEAESGPDRESLFHGPPDPEGTPYGLRYGLRVRDDRIVMVEECGRWFPDEAGRPALIRGTLRVEPEAQAGLSAGVRARAALIAHILDDVVETQRSRHALTLVVGELRPLDDEAESPVPLATKALRPLMRRRDRFLPLGPNRFALALASCGAQEAGDAARRALQLLDAAGLGERVRLGIASAPDHAFDAPQLLRRAEEALSFARGSTARFSLYEHPTRATPQSCRGTDALTLIGALNARCLKPAFRPVVDAQERVKTWHAATLRLLDGTGSALAVGDLRQAGERAGLACLLDARMLEEAASHLAAHADERVSLPLSPASLEDPEGLTRLAAHLGARPGIASRLILAIPERALVLPGLKGRLDAMKALGVGLALTGFGGGRATAQHLQSLPFDVVEIDPLFTQTLKRSTDDRFYLRALVEKAHRRGLAVVACGVDDEETARLLAGWGVDYLSGAIAGRAVLPSVADTSRAARAA